MNIDARWCGRASGSVTAMTMRKSAIDALEVNHLWPSMTHSPRLVEHGARLQQRRVGAGAVGLGHRERRAQVAGQQRVQPALLLLLLPASARISELPESGAWLPKALGAERRGAEDLVHEAELDLAEALAAELGRQVRRPQAALAHLLLQRRQRAVELRTVEVERLQRPDLLADEAAHPVQLGLELGLGREVPRHRRSPGYAACPARRTRLISLKPRWHRATSTGSPRSTRPSCTRRAPSRTCTSARSSGPRARRPPTTTSSTRSARACTSCRATASGSPSRRPRPGGRCGPTTPTSTSSTTCATPRCPRPAATSSS